MVYIAIDKYEYLLNVYLYIYNYIIFKMQEHCTTYLIICSKRCTIAREKLYIHAYTYIIYTGIVDLLLCLYINIYIYKKASDVHLNVTVLPKLPMGPIPIIFCCRQRQSSISYA